MYVRKIEGEIKQKSKMKLVETKKEQNSCNGSQKKE